MKLFIKENLSDVENAGIQYWLKKNGFEKDDYNYYKDMQDGVFITFRDMDDYYICEITNSDGSKMYEKEECNSFQDVKDHYKHYLMYITDDEEETTPDDDYEPYDIYSDEYDEYDDDPFGGSRWGDVSTTGRLF